VATTVLTGPLTAGAISSLSVQSGQGNYTAANVGTANISTLVVSTVQGNLRTTGNVYTSSINAPTGYVSTLGVSTIIGDYGNFSTLYVSTLFAPITTTGISTNTVSTNQLYATNGIISTLTVQGDTNISSIQGYNANYNNLSTVTGYIQTASVSTLTAPRVLGSVTFQNDVTVNGNLNISTALTAPSYNAVSTITSPTYLFGARNGGQIPFAITTNSTINSDASFYSASGMGFYPNTPNPSALIQGATPLMYLNNQIVNIPYNLSTNHFSTNTIDAMTGTFSTLNVSTITTANISTNNIQASGFVNCSTISTGSIVSNLVTAPSISTVQISSVSVTSLQAVIGNNLLVQSTINTPYIGGVLGNPMTLTSPVKGGTISANIGNFSTINVSTLNAPDIVSVSSLFTLEADISLAVISTLQFQPQFAPNIDLNLGAVVGGLVGGLSANAFNTLLGATALGTGIAGLTLPRTSGGVAPQNFQTVNGSTQLQVSTLTTPISTIFLTTDSTDPLHTPGNQISTVTTTTFGPGLFIRSISDPLNLADASSASTIQSFGQWVPVITPTTNIQANNINAVSANFTSSITAQTTITANGGLESVSTVVFTGASGTTFITAPTVTSQFKGPVSISTLNVSTVNGSSYPPPDQTIPIGCMLPFAGGSFTSVSVPSGYLLCNGNRILQSAYSALFAVIGYTYGPNLSDGYYSLPDTRGKVLAGTVDNNYSVEVSGLSVTLNGIVNGAFQVNTYNTPGQIFVGATISTINTPGSSTVYIIAIIHGNGSSTDPGSVTYLQLSTPVSFPSGNYYIVPNNVLPPSFTNQAMNAPTIGAIADLNRYNTQIGQAYHLQYITEVANHTHNYNQGGQQANAGIGGLPVGVPTNGGPVTGENNGLYSTPSGSYNKAMPLLPYNFACYYIIKY
jgi:hypothetical protein